MKKNNEPIRYFSSQDNNGTKKYFDNNQPVKKHKKQKRKNKGFFKKLFSFLIVVVCSVFVGVSAVAFYFLGKIDYMPVKEFSKNMGVSFNTSLANYQSLQTDNIKLADADMLKSPFVKNILILGTDERTSEFSSARSDSIMILSINRLTSEWSVVSLQRASAVLIPDMQPDWLTHTFSYGGPELVLATVKNHLKIDIEDYVRLNFASFENLINAIGGIDISITQTEAEYLIHRCGGSFGVGVVHLDGEFALHYARMRQTDNDWKRVERQRNVIFGVIQKAKNLNPIQLIKVADAVLPTIQTNLSVLDMYLLLLQAPFLMQNDMQGVTIPAEDTYYGYIDASGKSLNIVDYTKNHYILKHLLYD